MRRRKYAGLTPAQAHAKHLIEQGFVSVRGGEWRPGNYATERAKEAMGNYDELPPEERARLQEEGR